MRPCPTTTLAFLLVLLPVAAAAQFAEVRGRVADAATGEPLAGAAVVLVDEAGAQRGTTATATGAWVLTNVAPGTYALQASFVGYAPAIDTLSLGFGEQVMRVIELVPADEAVGEMVIEESAGPATGGGAGLVTVPPSVLARVPTPGGTGDLASYLLTLPGVVQTGDRGGQLFIRGGTPSQNLVLVDGVPLYQPFHIVGFYSAFPADLLAYADVYAGGFGARYGGRLSSVIDVATRNGSKTRPGGAVALAPFLSSVRVEVPVAPERVSVVASVRESVFERVAPTLVGRELPYRFGDRFAKLHAYLNTTSSLALTLLRTFDDGDVAGVTGDRNRIRWRNEAYGGRYTYLPPEAPVLMQASFYASRYGSNYAPSTTPARTAAVEGYGGEIVFRYFLGWADVQGGLFGRSYGFDYDLGRGRPFRESVTEGGVYLEMEAEPTPRWRLVPGVRVHSFPSRTGVRAEPRLRVAFRPGGAASRHTLSAAGGLYHQEIVGLYNLRDVTDAFVAWAPSPLDAAVPRAVHLIAGYAWRPAPGAEVHLEAYQKRLTNVSWLRYRDALDAAPTPERADGTAKGVDVRAEAARRWFYAYVGYGWARVRYTATAGPTAGQAYPPPHDRRHQANALLRLVRGRTALGARWQLGSGLPFTQAVGFYEHVPLERPDPAFRDRPAETRLETAEPFAARLPAYHRLDLTLEHTRRLGLVQARFQASAINAYSRANIFDYDLFTGRRVNQLPFIPSVGVQLEVR